MQEPLLFNEGIKDNIRYGTSGSSDSQVLEAAGQANCLQFIESDVD
jgi:ABC-type multidrug transport system fused ATPase/permease subunit